MEKYELQKLRDLPIEGVAERLGLQVTRHKCLCPFHEDHHPSMSFKKNKYRCWSCGESGDTISLVEKMLKMDFTDATRWLADEHNVIITEHKPREERPPKPFDASRYVRYFEHPFLNDEARHFLFDERRIDPRVVRWCRLTSWRDRQGVPWLQIPYYDREGKLVGVQNRNLKAYPQPLHKEIASPQLLPRFRFPPGSDCGIYNLPVLNLLKSGDDLYITEGCSDCWAMLSAGHKAVAIPSATLLGRSAADQLLDTQQSLGIHCHMYPDSDTPGERLFLQLQELLPGIIRHQLPPGCKDFAEAWKLS